MLHACPMVGVWVIKGYDTFVDVKDLPFIPFNCWVANEAPQHLWKRPAREGDCEAALFVDRVFLGFDKKSRKRDNEGVRVWERNENGCVWRLVDGGHFGSG